MGVHSGKFARVNGISTMPNWTIEDAMEGETAVAVLRQSYRSDTLMSNSTKTLRLVKVGGTWLIKQERVGG